MKHAIFKGIDRILRIEAIGNLIIIGQTIRIGITGRGDGDLLDGRSSVFPCCNQGTAHTDGHDKAIGTDCRDGGIGGGIIKA